MQRKRGTTAQLFGMRLPILFEICFFQDLMEQQHQHRFSAFWLRSKCSICSSRARGIIHDVLCDAGGRDPPAVLRHKLAMSDLPYLCPQGGVSGNV